MSDIIRLLKAEAAAAISGVAFRNLGTPGNNVSVKYQNNKDYCLPDSYSWLHRERRITENEAAGLLSKLPKEEVVKDIDLYIFQDGSTMKRENGHIYLPQNNGFSIPAKNRWVLRDVDGNALDVQKHRVDILSGWEPKIGKPLTEEERIGKQDMMILATKGTASTGRNIPNSRPKPLPQEAYFTIENYPGKDRRQKPNGRRNELSARQDPDEEVVDGLTFAEAMRRSAKEDRFI